MMQNPNSIKDEVAEAKKIIDSTVAALQVCKRRLDAYSQSTAADHALHYELIAFTLHRSYVCHHIYPGSVDLRFRDLAAWLADPIPMAAESFDVDRDVFCRWAKANDETDGRGGEVPVTCDHENCKMSRTISWQTPAEMHDAELTASSAVWFCHHHQQKAWDSRRVIAYDLLPILSTLKASPGCNKAKLPGKNSDIDFLVSLGLVIQKSVPRGTKPGYVIHLSPAGEKYLADLAEMSSAE